MENTNEIITNEEVIETVEEIAMTSSGNDFKIAAGIGLAVLGSIIAYKYVIKPMATKIKAKKEQKIEEKISKSNDDHDDEIDEESDQIA